MLISLDQMGVYLRNGFQGLLVTMMLQVPGTWLHLRV